ncbi:MAG: NAD(P)-dependent oxidoreductase, partial [Verrucomicrobiales bacterium]
VLIDMSSIPPDTAKDHAARLEGRGIDHIDAPVSGGTIGAEQGTLAIMGGGRKAVVERCRPILEVLGKVTYVGPHGSGQLTKLCNQVIVATTIGAVSEALLLASAGGALPEAVCEALQGGFADSRILREHGKRMLARDWRPGGSTEHQVKDLNAVKNLAESLRLNLPVLEQMRQLFQSFHDSGGGNHDHAALLLELERMNVPHRVNDAPDQFPQD